MFGDSNTYGHGHFDCLYCQAQPPSSMSWPSQLQKLIGSPGVEVVNKSIPGASCILIGHCIRSFQFREDDVVLILWSYLTRSTVFLDGKNYTSIGPNPEMISVVYDRNDRTDISIKMYNLLPDYDFEHKSACAVEHAHLNLTHRSIPFLSWYVNSIEVPGACMRDFYHGKYYDEKVFFDFKLDFAADGMHLGPESNLAFAEHVRRALIERLHLFQENTATP